MDKLSGVEIPLQLALLDIDNFKTINDTYAHRVGDIVLKRVSQAIKASITPDDIVARPGGEEFAVIFIGKSLDEAYSLAETIRLTIASMTVEELQGRQITVSIGLENWGKWMEKETIIILLLIIYGAMNTVSSSYVPTMARRIAYREEDRLFFDMCF